VDVLDSVVADACTQVDHHLMEVITSRFHFARHCDVLRRYLLLGQGDYVQALLELVSCKLSIRLWRCTGLAACAARASSITLAAQSQTSCWYPPCAALPGHHLAAPARHDSLA
jgi:hypothetical protein